MNVRFQGRSAHFRTVTFDGARNAVELIDQRSLPHQFRIVSTPDYRATAQAIRNMLVRGAGAIGATAAYGLAQGARSFRGQDLRRFNRHLHRVFATLHAARPTAVDPLNAMRELLDAMRPGQTVLERQALALAAAEQFAQRSVEECQAIGRHGAPLIRPGMRILTHCNAGWLAFVDYGSATAPLYAAHARRRRFHVYCDETRPRSQGATLTAWELAQQGISHEIIADNAAGHLMQRGQIDLVIVGSDRTLARTGEVANKIGTYTKAVLAARHHIPFYVALPFSTLDWTLDSGRDIPIEHRSPDEVLGAWGVPRSSRSRSSARDVPPPDSIYVRVANPSSTACNPGFDVTPPELITGIITPAGVFRPQDLWRHRRLLQPARDSRLAPSA
jgi:methylthioribose-1-phosphate isomerase